MKQILISAAEPGMVIAKPIYDEKERVLMRAGSKLTESFLKKLEEFGFNSICVETKDSEGIVINDVVPLSIKNKAARAIQNLDMPAVMESAKEIVDCICENSNTAIDLVDIRNDKNYDYQHAVTVAELSIAIGRSVLDSKGHPLTYDNLCDLAVAALLHDIGKRCADKRILEQLDMDTQNIKYTEELAPVFSYNLLKDNYMVSAPSRVGILFHKTDENGKSSPIKNIEPGKIHSYAKILHIADTYDTLITKKTLDGKRVTSLEAIEYLMANCNTKFNAELVRIFIKYVPIYPKGSSVKLSNGMNAVVYENVVERMMRPKVMLEDKRIIDLFEHPYITIIDEVVSYEEVSENVKGI